MVPEGPGTFAPRRAGERLPLSALLFMSNVNSVLYQLKPTPKPECPESQEFLRKTISVWVSNPRLVFLKVRRKQIRLVSADLSNWLNATAIKVSLGV